MELKRLEELFFYEWLQIMDHLKFLKFGTLESIVVWLKTVETWTSFFNN